MPLIWCSISAHGYGHAAQVVPVLNELGRRVRDLRVILRTLVPAGFFEPRLAVPWELRPAQQDVGCIQNGPLEIDVPGTWTAHRTFHTDWQAKVQEEARQIRAASPKLVLSDISHLGIAAGAAIGCPTVGLCSLSWDMVLEMLQDRANGEQAALIDQIRDAYARAELFLRVTPGLSMTAFPKLIDIGPIAEPGQPQPERLRQAMGARESDRIVLVGFGGIPLKHLPFARMETMPHTRFVVDGPIPHGLSRIRSLTGLNLPFKTVLASVDLIMTKPGYGTIVEAVALRKPVVYVRRFNFADEQSLVDYLHRHGQGAELTRPEFTAGVWADVLEKTFQAPPPPAPPPNLTGPSDAAAMLAQYCGPR